MKLSIGIVGLPNVGKSTLFKVLTNIPVNIANYPFCTIDPNVGVVAVPDERLDRIYEMSLAQASFAQGSGRPGKIPAVVEFYDIAGLVKGASKGEGLGNQFLAHIRATDAILLVLRAFKNDEITHVENTVDPLRDMEILEVELALKDLETIEKIWKKAEAEAKTGNKEAQKNFEVLKVVRTALESSEVPLPKILGGSGSGTSGGGILRELQLLTAKPQLFLINGVAEDVSPELLARIKSLDAGYVIIDLKRGMDESAMRPHSGDEPTVNEVIRKSYHILNLISFFTTGEDETRAWTIVRGTKAPQAAGVIHTDFEKNFIRAEVINWQKLLEAHSTNSGQSPWAIAKQKGWLRLEGKEYAVQDGDVLVVRHG